jgi:hypothetical protein
LLKIAVAMLLINADNANNDWMLNIRPKVQPASKALRETAASAQSGKRICQSK